MARNSSLDEISVAIGRLQSGQKATADHLADHMRTSVAQNNQLAESIAKVNADLAQKINEIKESMDSKIEKRIGHYFSGGIGGGAVIVLDYFLNAMGFKIPGSH